MANSDRVSRPRPRAAASGAQTAVVPATPPGTVRRVVVLPSLWAPFHHRPAVAALTAYVDATRPDRIVLLDAPQDPSDEAWPAFRAVVAGFRTVCCGPIDVHGCGKGGAPELAELGVSVLPPLAPIAPGWLATRGNPMQVDADVLADADAQGANILSGGTGRLRLTGRAVPGVDGRAARAWLVFECGVLAADPAVGTLGFGVLEDDRTCVTARPVRVGKDGSFTVHGVRYAAPERPSAGEVAPRVRRRRPRG
jgi:hypothetical protein